MKIGYKLILGYLLVATLASFTTYFTIESYGNINAEFETMVNDPLPMIKVLEGLGQSGIRIVSSTTEFGFLHNEAALLKDKKLEDQQEAEEEELIESGRALFDQSLKSYELLIKKTGDSNDEKFFLEIKSAGNELIKTSQEIVELKKKGVVGEEVLELKEQFEDQERTFLGLVEKAKEKEYQELADEQKNVAETIAVSTRRTVLITIFTFLLAIGSGIYISRQIARRIVRLKEASQRVSRGEFDTQISFNSKDEIGDLGNCFNLMVTELKNSRAELLSSKNFVDNIFHSMPDIMCVINLDGTINRVNRGMLDLTAYREDELLGLKMDFLNGDAELFPAENFKQLKTNGFTTGVEKRCRTKEGKLIPISISVSILRHPNGKAIGFVCVAQNISERKHLENKLTHQALHDPLTGLANRVLFHNRVEHALALASRSQSQLAVLFLDLDNFKNINDSLGHVAGDELLQGVAARLGNCLRASDTAARLGGDEFALLLEQLTQDDYAINVAERVLETLRDPFIIAGKEVFIQASIGIAHSKNACETPEELLRNADVAMYIAKSGGKGRFSLFEPQMHEDLMARIELEANLRQAIENKEFVLLYQPIIEFKTGRIAGMEALIRWHRPGHGVVMPLDFIPIAEETGLIVPLGVWILEEACRQASSWQKKFKTQPLYSITVNLSGRQFNDPQIVETVALALRKSGLPPENLILEITESMMLQNTETMIERLSQLKALGVRLAIDDFGTGYSSLSYLHRFPIDIIKIDRSFVSKIEDAAEDAAVARAIIMMSDSLCLRTIAEGIENTEQREMLKNMGCEFGQGYLFAKPLSSTEFAGLLAQSNDDVRKSLSTERMPPAKVYSESAEVVSTA